MGRIAVVGDATSVAGFRPLGFAVFPVEDPGQARELWPELASGAYSVVLVTEQVWGRLADLAATVADRLTPAVTVIPGVGSAGGVGEARMSAAIERALGTKLPFQEGHS